MNANMEPLRAFQPEDFSKFSTLEEFDQLYHEMSNMLHQLEYIIAIGKGDEVSEDGVTTVRQGHSMLSEGMALCQRIAAEHGFEVPTPADALDRLIESIASTLASNLHGPAGIHIIVAEGDSDDEDPVGQEDEDLRRPGDPE